MIHSCTIEGDTSIGRELLELVVTSGLGASLEMCHISNVGDSWGVDEPRVPISVHNHAEPVTAYEIPTLQLVQSVARTVPDGAVLYLMTKGVRRHGYADEWRRYMTYFLVERWRHALIRLFEGGAQAVGCDLLGAGTPQAHFSGNCWWARADYLVARPPPMGGDDPHHASEQWLLDEATPAGELHCSGNNHYEVPYPRSAYAVA